MQLTGLYRGTQSSRKRRKRCRVLRSKESPRFVLALVFDRLLCSSVEPLKANVVPLLALQMRVFWQYIQGMVSRFNYSPSLTTELIILFSFCSLRTWERYRSLGSIPRSTCLHRVTKERRRTNSKRYSKRSKPRVSFEKLLLDLGRLSNRPSNCLCESVVVIVTDS